ncbi:MAG: histidinol-phosphate transaminase [Spirochaetota bacterium]
MSKYWSRGIAGLATYVPGEQPQDRRYVKLNTNENPYPPSPRVLEAIQKANDERLRLYPDPECVVLREAIARRHRLTREEVFVGNGSDEILAFAFAAFFDRGEAILYPDISYSFYPVYADFFKLSSRTVALNGDFSIPVDAFLVPNGGIIFPNPNAPTSIALGLGEIRRILDHNLALGRVVVIDEAYVDFGAESSTGLVGDYPNLLVVQTLSKSRSLAGLRGGFAFGHRDLVEGLSRVKNSINSYTLDRLVQAGATAAILDEAWFEETRVRVMRTRDRVAAQLRALGFDVADSRANFLFISHARAPAAELYSRLKEKGVLVRYFKKPRIDNHLRVSVGTDEEMDGFLVALSGILGSLR